MVTCVVLEETPIPQLNSVVWYASAPSTVMLLTLSSSDGGGFWAPAGSGGTPQNSATSRAAMAAAMIAGRFPAVAWAILIARIDSPPVPRGPGPTDTATKPDGMARGIGP